MRNMKASPGWRPVSLAFSICVFAADPGFLRRQAQDVAPKPDDLTAAGSQAASYKPFFGMGDADADQLKSVARYGELTVAPVEPRRW